MGTLSSELAPHADRLSPRPRIYADANVPAGLIAYMRTRLGWDVLFVLEEPPLRRAPDVKHYRLAHQLRRTLVTMDRDYLDDRRFPPEETSGVLVTQAGQTMEQIVASIRDVSVIVSEIAHASSEQNGGIQEVNLAITHIDEGTQQNAALVEQAAAAAKSLQDEAHRLSVLVGGFKM